MGEFEKEVYRKALVRKLQDRWGLDVTYDRFEGTFAEYAEMWAAALEAQEKYEELQALIDHFNEN